MPVHVVAVGPLQNRPAGELYPVFADDARGPAIEPDQCAQLPRNPGAGDAGVGHQARVFSAAIIVHGENTEPA